MIVKSYQHKDVVEEDIQGIHDFVRDAEIVEGSDELYAIVAEVWPELLHKVKPPLSSMH